MFVLQLDEEVEALQNTIYAQQEQLNSLEKKKNDEKHLFLEDVEMEEKDSTVVKEEETKDQNNEKEKEQEGSPGGEGSDND